MEFIMSENASTRVEKQELFSREGRLPPGQSLTQIFPVLHYGPVPAFNAATWDFRIWGLVEQEIRWTWDQLQDLPHTKLILDIHCVTRWSKFNTVWEGVSIPALISKGLIKLKPTARFVIQHAEYGFTTNLPLDIVLQENFLLATHYNGEPLTPEHGYPLRGVIGQIPGKNELKTPYFWKGAKWLRGLEFVAQDQQGFWEKAGYHNDADVWKEQRFREPDSQ
jgi:DMSO/TMAO reductase YedYZ molybdopterin-dependent catalytic subunit